MVKRSVFGRGGWAQTGRLGGGVKLATEGGAAASGHVPRGGQGPGQGPRQGGLWSPGRRPQLLPGTSASPARRHITRNTARGPSSVSSHAHTETPRTTGPPQRLSRRLWLPQSVGLWPMAETPWAAAPQPQRRRCLQGALSPGVTLRVRGPSEQHQKEEWAPGQSPGLGNNLSRRTGRITQSATLCLPI